MHFRPVSLALAAAVLLYGAVSEAQPQPYFRTSVGMSFAPAFDVHGSDNDWSTKCDLIINPLGIETGSECDTAPPLTSWTNGFGGADGARAGLAFGYDWGRFRLEGEYVYGLTVHDDRSDIDIFDDVTLDKQEQEIESAMGSVDDVQSHSLFANIYYDFDRPSSLWTPYVGVGAGVGRISLDYGTVWKRNDDPARIATFTDPLLRAKIAGTTTIGEARMTDTVVAFQMLGGIERRLRENLTLGIRFRWGRVGEFESEPRPWDQLRSHDSTVGRGEPILYRVRMGSGRFWGASLGLTFLL